MRRIERTGRFKRDYKRELKGHHRATLETVFIEVLKMLINDTPLNTILIVFQRAFGILQVVKVKGGCQAAFFYEVHE